MTGEILKRERTIDELERRAGQMEHRSLNLSTVSRAATIQCVSERWQYG